MIYGIIYLDKERYFMRRYHIYFEPFVDKIRVNQYIGLDMSFYSELLPVESLIYILDTVIIDELTF